MQRRKRPAAAVVAAALAWVFTATVSAAEPDESSAPTSEAARKFESRIVPLLTGRCLECHGAATKKGGLDLSRKEAALAGGESGKVLVPGKSADSLLWQHVDSNEMPKGRAPLSEQEKKLLKEWIEAGAVWTRETIGPAAARERFAGANWVRRLTVPEYIETVRSAVGVDVEQDARRLLPPDLRADGFSNTAYSLNVDLAHVEAYARLAEIVVERMDVAKFAGQFSDRRDLSEAALRDVISRMGKWLLRGPLDEHEVAAYLGVARTVASQGGDDSEAMRYVIEAMLQSPRFIYRIERQTGDGSSPVGAYELASRLSYVVWGAPPDRELLRAAEAGELADRGNVVRQVQRMLQDPRTVEQSARFIYEWMDLDRLAHLRPNPERFSKWESQLAADMREETLAFFKHVAWEEKRPLADLLNAQVTFATPRLSAYYGLDPAQAKSASALGSEAATEPSRASPRVAAGLQVLYTFEEGRGDTVRDASAAGDPLHLKIADAAAVRWTDQGLVIRSAGLIASAEPPKRLIDAVKKSKAITLEAWITPADATQAGPARIVTLSADPNQRNFTLGQDGARFDVRFRTTKTTDNGTPSLASPAGAVTTAPTHVVYTRDAADKGKLFINGEERAAADVTGDLSNWGDGFRLALANELTRDRPWQGTLHLVAVYDRALPRDEVQSNHAAGHRAQAATGETELIFGIADRKDLQALYRFNEGSGDNVRDVSGSGEPLHLRIENASSVAWERSGLTVQSPTLIAAAAPPKRLIDAIKKSKAVTLEAWVTPGDVKQAGPARILTLSDGVLQRNFTLGQIEDKYDVRFRGSATDASGLPSLTSPSGAVATRLTHVVYTRDAAGKAKLYINGDEAATREVPGDLANWDGGFRLALANEISKDRPWLGTYHQIAVYSRALSPEEVRAISRPREARAGLARYDLTSHPGRGGLLTQGSVLTIGGEEASMVSRGLFLLQELLSSKVEDPPPCVDTTPVPPKPGLTRRAIAESRIANASCRGCHAKFEPLAFGLEKFDGLGAYHDKDEHGNQLREDGEVLFPGQEQPVAYKSSAELMDLLAGSDRVRMAITRKVTQFALGRPLVESDGPILDEIHAQAQEGGGTYASLITAIVMSDLVQKTHLAPAPLVESPPPAPAKNPERIAAGLHALYTFQEQGGDVVREVSGAGEPLHLKIGDAGAVRWSDAGLTIESATLIAGDRPPQRLIDAVKKSRSVTLEAWVTPADKNQQGPARILTLSSGTGQRNFTLGQEGDKFDVRLRTTKTDGNGLPSLAGPSGSAATRLTHVVYTRDASGKTKLYIDGQEAAAGNAAGDLSNWDGSFRLALANETTRDRPWRGTLHLAAIYDRALSAEEVEQNYAAGYQK